MANEISTWQRNAYRDGIILALQQRRSKIRAAVREDGKDKGVRVFFDLLSPTTMAKRTARVQPTVLTDQIHTRRCGTMDRYEVFMPVDPIDIPRIGSDPTSSYQQNGIMACERQIDDVILATMIGTTYEGEDGSTSVAFNAGGSALVAAGGLGLTVDKIISVRKQYMTNNVDLDTEQLYWAYGAEQLEDLLNMEEIRSKDYTRGALEKGDMIPFMGFNWIPTNRLGVGAAAGQRRNITWVKSGVGFLLRQSMEVSVDKRPDLSNAWQVGISIDCGSVRVEDGKVIAVDCVE